MRRATGGMALAVLVGLLMAGLAAASMTWSPEGPGSAAGASTQPEGGEARAEAQPAELQEVEVGEVAPGFDLPDVGDRRMALAVGVGERPVLLVIWAVWCPPCIDEFEELKRLHAAYAGRGLEIVAVGVRYHQSFDEVRTFARDIEAPFPVLYDEHDKVVQNYGVQFIPSNYLIDRSGVIRFKANGLPSDMDRRVEAVLEGA